MVMHRKKCNKREEHRMNIGLRLHDTISGTLEERLRFIKGQGFSCAHTALSKVLDDFRMEDAPSKLTKEFASELQESFGKAGIDCVILGCYLNLANPDPEEREKTGEIYRAHLRFAPMMGASMVGTETPANPNSRFAKDPWEDEDAFRFLVDCLRPAVRWAEEAGTILAVEPVYRHILSTPERAERLLTEIPSDSLRIILDAVNLLAPDAISRADEIIGEAIRRLGDRVVLLHMKDYLPGEEELNAVACGRGRMRYEQLISLAMERHLPMTLENTMPDNAEAARLHLEAIGEKLRQAKA